MTVSDTSVRQAHIGQVLTLFSDPPSLYDVAVDSAQAYLDVHFSGRQ